MLSVESSSSENVQIIEAFLFMQVHGWKYSEGQFSSSGGKFSKGGSFPGCSFPDDSFPGGVFPRTRLAHVSYDNYLSYEDFIQAYGKTCEW